MPKKGSRGGEETQGERRAGGTEEQEQGKENGDGREGDKEEEGVKEEVASLKMQMEKLNDTVLVLAEAVRAGLGSRAREEQDGQGERRRGLGMEQEEEFTKLEEDLWRDYAGDQAEAGLRSRIEIRLLSTVALQLEEVIGGEVGKQEEQKLKQALKWIKLRDLFVRLAEERGDFQVAAKDFRKMPSAKAASEEDLEVAGILNLTNWRCYRCNRVGHLAEDCPRSKTKSGSKYPQTRNEWKQ